MCVRACVRACVRVYVCYLICTYVVCLVCDGMHVCINVFANTFNAPCVLMCINVKLWPNNCCDH